MNIYTAKMVGGTYPDHYYILANSIAQAYELVCNHTLYSDGLISSDNRIPTTDISVLLDKYENVHPDKIPMLVLFARNNEEYWTKIKPVFRDRQMVAKWFTDLLTEECNKDYCKWVDETTHVENK